MPIPLNSAAGQFMVRGGSPSMTGRRGFSAGFAGSRRGFFKRRTIQTTGVSTAVITHSAALLR
jgi:hypothetical protein